MENIKAAGNIPQIPYSIYQLKETQENRDLLFVRYKDTKLPINSRNYRLIYSDVWESSSLELGWVLKGIFQKFNCSNCGYPADFKGHSLSVSDVIVVQYEGKNRAFYCDCIGFKEIPEFLTSEDAGSDEKRRTCSERNCIANVSGFCAVDKCRGAITRLKNPRKQEPSFEIAAKGYQMMKEIFDEEFGSMNKDK